MALTLTEIFADKIDERFNPVAVTAAIVNQDYNFDGAKTVKVTSIETVATSDYNRTTGYPAASVLNNKIQSLTMSQDKSFKIVLDKMDENETKIRAGEVIARELKEVIIPEIEAYRLGKMLDAAFTNNMTVTAGSSAYEDILKMSTMLDDADVPQTSRFLLVTPEFMASLKTDANFVKASDIGQKMLLNGQIGEIDGVPVIKAKKTWLTDNQTSANSYKALMVHKSATVAPIKLQEYKAITDSEQYSGTVFVGRYYYDAFVLDSKKFGIVGLK